MQLLDQYNPHLADEEANLSPAKQPNCTSNFSSAFTSSEGVSAQASYGFALPTEQAPVLGSAQFQTSESESDSSSDESESEPDSELSDNELDDTVTLPSSQNTASYCRQVTQPFDLGIVGGTGIAGDTCKVESDEPLKRISQQLSKPTSHRKKLAAALACNSGLLSHSSRSVQNSEEAPVSQKRSNRDNMETPAKVPKIETPEEKIQLCDLSDNTRCELEESASELRAESENGESLLVKIPLSKVQLEAHQKIKPQARVIPIPNVNSGSVGRKRTNSEVNNSEVSHLLY